MLSSLLSTAVSCAQGSKASMRKMQVLQENETLRAQNEALSSSDQAAEFATLLEAAEQENLELQRELQHAQELSSSLAAALQGAQASGTQLQAANSELLEQLSSLGVQPHIRSPTTVVAPDTVRCLQ
jgi:hypothetical protein